jgi:hypothetical protein
MDMVPHQNVGMNGTSTGCSGSCQAFQIEAPIRFSEEAWRPVIAPLDDMKGHTGKL